MVLGHDLGDEAGQGRHLEEPQADPDRRQLLGAVTPVEAAARDGAHLVVQLRPTDATPPVAEAHEVDGLGLRVRRGGKRTFASVRSVHRWPVLQSCSCACRSAASVRKPTGRVGGDVHGDPPIEASVPPGEPSAARWTPIVGSPGRTRRRGFVHQLVHQLVHMERTFGRIARNRRQTGRAPADA